MKQVNLTLAILIFFLAGIASYSQNIVITDDDAYTANSSAMLDVKSVSKGLLIPRVTTSQRNAIVGPANSLLVFDVDISAFFFWTGASWTKIGTANSDYWLPDGANIYFTAGNVGVGTSSPGRKMIVKGSSANLNEAIFAVQNTDGDTVFAVYPEGVRVWVNDDGGSKASGNRGGFAVGGFCPSKAGFTNEYLRVTPDSVRVYIDDDFTGNKASGNRGGFAVGGFNPSKGSITDDYLFVQDDSTRVWTDGGGGFEVRDISLSNDNYLDLNPENYFIGHNCGVNSTGNYNIFVGYSAGNQNTTGEYGVFMGYNAGTWNTTGAWNVFIGHQSGMFNEVGAVNTFVGTFSGRSNVGGASNVFLGNETGYSNLQGCSNVFVGNGAGYEADNSNNVYIGSNAGHDASGNSNVFIGNNTGYSEAGSNKLYIDNSNTPNPLLYGDFASNYVYVNGHFKATGILYDSGGDAGISGQILSSTGTGTNWISSPGNITGTGTATQIAFWTGASTLSSNAKLYWDNTNFRLGINVTPSYKLQVVDDITFNDAPAIYGNHTVTNNYGVGVQGIGGYKGVLAQNNSTTGINYGLHATSTGSGATIHYGIYTEAYFASTNYGIYATASGGTTNYAGYFQGNVHVNGTLSKSAGTFKIDHPQDPENKYLIHSFVESPDMKNVYDGIAVCDNSGKAIVVLPGYFESLNKDFRYQLTTIGGYAPVYIEQEIQNGQFIIAGGNSGMKVSWQVTGIRKDPYAVQNPIIVEQEKNISEKGLYLNPELYNKSKNSLIHKANEK